MSQLRETLVEEMKDIYDAEKQLTKALPKMAKAAENDELREAFETHLEETENHIERLDRVFEMFDEQPKSKRCKAMQGLVEEGEEIIKQEEGDAGLICAAQKVEHYEIAAYGSLAAWARLLGENEAAELLHEILEEEKETDQKLTSLAETVINVEENEEAEGQENQGRRRMTASRSRARKPVGRRGKSYAHNQ